MPNSLTKLDKPFQLPVFLNLNALDVGAQMVPTTEETWAPIEASAYIAKIRQNSTKFENRLQFEHRYVHLSYLLTKKFGGPESTNATDNERKFPIGSRRMKLVRLAQ